jgi:anthranilate synthase component 2
MKKIILIDNYDSFTYNLANLILYNFNGKLDVVRNDKLSLEDIDRYNAIVISPGPKKPKDAIFSNQVINNFYREKPILGVCLGMQIINEVFGGETDKAPYPVHGKTSLIKNNKYGIFSNLPTEFKVARYHSLICRVVSKEFIITAEKDGIPMAIQHKFYKIFGVQFHPESFLTEFGNEMMKNFLKCSGLCNEDY